MPNFKGENFILIDLQRVAPANSAMREVPGNMIGDQNLRPASEEFQRAGATRSSLPRPAPSSLPRTSSNSPQNRREHLHPALQIVHQHRLSGVVDERL